MHSLTDLGSSNSRKACDVVPTVALAPPLPPPPEREDSGGLEGRTARFLILPKGANVARTDASVAPAGMPRTMTVLVGGSVDGFCCCC